MKLASAVLSARPCICLRSPFKLPVNAFPQRFQGETDIPVMQTRCASLSIQLLASSRSIYVSLQLFFPASDLQKPALRCIHVVLAQSARWVPLFFPALQSCGRVTSHNSNDEHWRSPCLVHKSAYPRDMWSSSDHSRVDHCFELKRSQGAHPLDKVNKHAHGAEKQAGAAMWQKKTIGAWPQRKGK